MPSGDWHSRPIVWMPACKTTLVSTVLSVFGQIWLNLDKYCNWHTFTPLMNTMGLVTRLQAGIYRRPHDLRTVACSTFDFTSLYTNITWHNLLRTWEWWKKWYKDLTEDKLWGGGRKLWGTHVC